MDTLTESGHNVLKKGHRKEGVIAGLIRGLRVLQMIRAIRLEALAVGVGNNAFVRSMLGLKHPLFFKILNRF
jgi:hypothetical protein